MDKSPASALHTPEGVWTPRLQPPPQIEFVKDREKTKTAFIRIVQMWRVWMWLAETSKYLHLESLFPSSETN